MSDLTQIMIDQKDLGKNLYRNKTYYTLCIEQDVLANTKDEADKLFLDNGGINHSNINKDLTDANNGVETYMVDANYTDSGKTEFIAKVVYDEYDGLENAKENGDVELDTNAFESAKDESDVDVALNLEIDAKEGK